MPKLTNHHIKSIHLKRLFGRYTYSVPKNKSKTFDVLNIFYGENGLGKTTLLNLIYHLLSPATDRGHTEYVASVPFELIEITLQDDTVISATKDPQLLTGPTVFRISGGPKTLSWQHLPNVAPSVRAADLPENINVNALPKELRADVAQLLAQREYFKALAQLRATPVMLTSDRILLADSLETDRRRRPGAAQERGLAEAVSDQRRAAVANALKRASEWLQGQLFATSYRVTSVSYENVVNRIVATPYKTSSGLSKSKEIQIKTSLAETIKWIHEKSLLLSNFGISGGTVSPKILATISASSGNKLHLIENVLSPHLDEVRQRIDQLWPIYELIFAFTDIVNRFFRDKKITYQAFEGLKIVSTGSVDSSELFPHHLSSGEQQLMLIFCYVLTGRDSPTIFIIDEPEISLNITWQRMLVSSLEELAGASECQFLFASHSMEILSKHSKRVLELEDA